MKLPLFVICGMTLAGFATAQTTVYTEPVGFVSVTVPATSDATLSVPLLRPAVFIGTVLNIDNIASHQITLSSAPTLTAGVPYALYIANGSKEGMTIRVASQVGTTALLNLTLDAGDDYNGIAVGTQVRVMPYWTPASLLPSTVAAGTQILTFENPVAGTTISATAVYAHAGAGVWRNVITTANVSQTPLAFGSSFVLRNLSASPLTVAFVGDVPVKNHRLKLATRAASTNQDIRFGYTSPVAETLQSVGLTGGTVTDGDEIHVYHNNATTGYNKGPSLILHRAGGAWLDPGNVNVGATFQFTPGSGYVYRKVGSGSPTVFVWNGTPSYLPLTTP